MSELLIARSEKNDILLLTEMLNRHGIITGATGTGKTVTVQLLAEKCSSANIPVFIADVKGDIAGLSQPGEMTPRLSERLTRMKIDPPKFRANPVIFWDLFANKGHPLRTTVSEMGPQILARVLNLNDIQGDLLALIFKIADDNGLLLIDFKDFNSLLDFVTENRQEVQAKYGNIAPATLGAIKRNLLILQDQKADIFFGEPALNIEDFLQSTIERQGYINILTADRLLQSPEIYSMFLLWLLSELFENLSEIGDQEKPRLLFFFDEAHLLFNELPAFLLKKIEQVIRLIRSRGVGIFFITQSPADIPEIILGQLGNRIQHALRSYTVRDQKAIKVAAQSFRQNPQIDFEKAVQQLEIGEALISLLDAKGQPNIVERAMILTPASRIGTIEDAERNAVIRNSPFAGYYEKTIDRISAYEELLKRKQLQLEAAEKQVLVRQKGIETPSKPGRPRDSLLDAMMKSTMRSAGSYIGRSIIRGILGSIFKK